jgi:hypothetical protein
VLNPRRADSGVTAAGAVRKLKTPPSDVSEKML